MNESDYGYQYDVSYSPVSRSDVVQIDTDDGTLYLTANDLDLMRSLLDED